MFRNLIVLGLASLMMVSSAAADAPSTASKAAKPAAKAAQQSRAKKETIKKGVSIDQLDGPRLAGAIGHFSRARQLLLAAINEFDSGTKIANPDILINSDAWRKAVMDQATQLDRVLAPQAADPKGGIKYPGDSRLLTESIH